MDNLTPPTIQRVRVRFATHPDTARASGVASFTLQELTVDEEIMASKRASNDAIQYAGQLALASLVAVNDKPVSLSDGSADKAYAESGPKVRNLIAQAYASLHNPTASEADFLLKSRVVEVG